MLFLHVHSHVLPPAKRFHTNRAWHPVLFEVFFPLVPSFLGIGGASLPTHIACMIIGMDALMFIITLCVGKNLFANDTLRLNTTFDMMSLDVPPCIVNNFPRDGHGGGSFTWSLALALNTYEEKGHYN